MYKTSLEVYDKAIKNRLKMD